MTAISIIIVNWNTKEFLKDCLDSIPEACSDNQYEVIIADNASSDDSSGFIKGRYTGIKLIENRENIGFAKACNQAAKMAVGRYLFFLNPDTILQKDSISKLLKFIENESRAGIAGPQLLKKNGGIENSVRKFPLMKDALVRDTILDKIIPQFKKPRLAQTLPLQKASAVDQVSGAALLIRGELWKKLDGMDERFFMFYEEVDLCRRIKEMGFSVFYLPAAKIIHLGGGSRHKDRGLVFYHSIKSKFLYFEKYYPGYMVLLFKCVYKPLFLLRTVLGLKKDFVKRYLLKFLFL